MQLLSMMDTANPDAPLARCDVAGGYIGGRAEHVWSAAQWRAQSARYRLPIWVFDFGQHGDVQAREALKQLAAIGCPDHVTVALDMETGQDPIQVDQWGKVMHGAHFLTMVYGSTSTLFANPPRSGYWVADPRDHAHLYEHPLVLATQWALDTKDDNGQSCDRSVIRADVQLWDTVPATPNHRPSWETSALSNLARVEEAARAARFHLINRT
jgi:hypothetical protein